MPKRRAPESAAIEFFETADLASAQIVLNIAKDIVKRRAKPRPTTRPRPAASLPLDDLQTRSAS